MLEHEVIDRLIEGKKAKIKTYPQHVTRASEVGHPCERYLVYSVTNWADRSPYPPEVQFIFEGGRVVEDLAVQDFEDAGFKVYRPEPDRAIMESRPQISGHVDIRVDFGDGKVYTGEIKGLNAYDWESLNTIADFHRSKKPWIRKYPAQLMTYLYIKGEERGFFYLKSIPRFQPKFIWVDLDLGYMESILQKTERVEKHIHEKTFPDRLNDAEICEGCPFAHICLPELKREALSVETDEQFIADLERREQLKEIYKEYNELDNSLKKRFAERESIAAGDFLILGSWVDKKQYTVPESKYIKYKIMRLNNV
ncbi:MAG: hypothetical protein WC477_06050 [Patescibacteria group bacterium]